MTVLCLSLSCLKVIFSNRTSSDFWHDPFLFTEITNIFVFIAILTMSFYWPLFFPSSFPLLPYILCIFLVVTLRAWTCLSVLLKSKVKDISSDHLSSFSLLHILVVTNLLWPNLSTWLLLFYTVCFPVIPKFLSSLIIYISCLSGWVTSIWRISFDDLPSENLLG